MEESKVNSVLKVNSIEALITPHLEDSVKELMKNEFTGLGGDNYIIKYLGIQGSTSDEKGSSEKLANLVNKYALAFKTFGKLKGGFIKYDCYFGADLPEESLKKGPRSIYLAYIAVSPEAGKIIDVLIKNKLSNFIEESTVPSENVA